MSWQRYRYYDFFPRSTPKKAKGGIKARSKRGRLGEGWLTELSTSELKELFKLRKEALAR